MSAAEFMFGGDLYRGLYVRTSCVSLARLGRPFSGVVLSDSGLRIRELPWRVFLLRRSNLFVTQAVTAKRASSKSLNPGAPGGTRTPDRLVRSHTDAINISTRTVTCDACRIRKPDVTRCFSVSPNVTVAQIWHTWLWTDKYALSVCQPKASRTQTHSFDNPVGT